MVAVDLLYNRTKFGRAMKAVAVDRDTAALMGISPKKIVRRAFVLSAILAAVAGYLIAPLSFANINMGFDLGVKGFVAAVLGGIDSARGAMAGGVLLGLFEAFLPQILGLINADLAKFPDPFVFLLFVLMLVFRPQGMFGTSIREAR
jgi:branched-chain amino acid transport system permease protein